MTVVAQITEERVEAQWLGIQQDIQTLDPPLAKLFALVAFQGISNHGKIVMTGPRNPCEVLTMGLGGVKELVAGVIARRLGVVVDFVCIVPDDPKPALKAIPTTYSGVTFRSRLEARWAAFYDETGRRWEFEPEGYELPSGRYLPDFWMPDGECFEEIKPTVDAVNLKKVTELVQHTRKDCIVRIGPPWDCLSFSVRHSNGFADRWQAAANRVRAIRFWDPS